MPRRFAGVLAAGALQLVALVLAHELVFLARYGSRYGEALVHAGHGQTWSAAVVTCLALGGLVAGVAVLRLARLGLLVRRAGGSGSRFDGLPPVSLARAWARNAPRIAVVSVVLLSIQENIERAATGGVMPGPAILLTPEYAGGLWITIGVALAVALVAALFQWRRDVLLARLRAARVRLPRGTQAPILRRSRRTVPGGSLLGRGFALRAPPVANAH